MRTLGWCTLLVAAACGGSEAPAVTVLDSAGVRIVVNREPLWSADEGWTVAPDPLLDLGSVEGDPDLAFDRLSGAYLVGPDRLAVLDQGAAQVGFFNLEGERVASFGAPGQGPGEFRSLSLLGLRADSLWLLDTNQTRVTVVSSEGALGRIFRLPADNVRLGGAGLLPDGSAVVVADLAFASPTPEAMSPGFQRFEAAYLRTDGTAGTSDTILVTEGSEATVMIGQEVMQVFRPLFARAVSHEIWADRLAQSSQSSYEIGVYDRDGRLETLIRRDDVDLRLDEDAYEAAVEARVQAAPEGARAGLRIAYRDMPRPDDQPALTGLLADSEGFLWARDFSYEGDARDWAVFNPEGRWLGTVRFPDRFQPSQILRDRVVGVWTDELDVEHVRIYPLVR